MVWENFRQLFQRLKVVGESPDDRVSLGRVREWGTNRASVFTFTSLTVSSCSLYVNQLHFGSTSAAYCIVDIGLPKVSAHDLAFDCKVIDTYVRMIRRRLHPKHRIGGDLDIPDETSRRHL